MKQNKKKDLTLNTIFLRSFNGKHLSDVANWYPISIRVQDVIDYMIQIHEYEAVAAVLKYDNETSRGNSSYTLRAGLLTFCHIIDLLSTRYTFAMYQNVDNWIENEMKHQNCTTRAIHKKHMTYYDRQDYNEYLEDSWEGKHYITPYELRGLVYQARHEKDVKKLADKDFLDCPWSLDSLYIALYQHHNDKGIRLKNYREVIDTIFTTKDNKSIHEGWKQEFLKYNDFLSKRYSVDDKDTFQNKMMIDHFLKSEYTENEQYEDDVDFSIDYDKLDEI